MKKALSLILALALCLSLCACGSAGDTESIPDSKPEESKFQEAECTHEYTESVTKEASCSEVGEKALTCARCGDTYTETVEKLGHDYSEADCENAATCKRCGNVQGEALGHNDNNGTCTRCGAVLYYSPVEDSTWLYTIGMPDGLYFVVLTFDNGTFCFKKDLADSWDALEPEEQDRLLLEEPERLIIQEGYVQGVIPKACFAFTGTYTVDGDIITLTTTGANPKTLVLQRISETQLKSIEYSDPHFDVGYLNKYIPNGT